MYKFIDLFAGIGGIRIAFESSGAMCVASSEIDENARKTYYTNFNEYPLGDIKKIEANELPDFDIVAGGFPCQPFSIGGLRKGFDDIRGTLFFEIARIVNEKKPKVIFLENVSGLVSHDGGKTLSVIESTLENIGYSFGWKVMNACDYGIPQNRNRWYCVCFRKDLNIGFKNSQKCSVVDSPVEYFVFPNKCDLKYTLNDVVLANVPNDYNISDIAEKNINKYFKDFKSSNRYVDSNITIANEIRASRCNFRCDGISPCLTAKMGTGGNNVPVYVAGMRKLTEKECLKIMGFPEWFKISKNSMNSYKQIGNSVVVPIIEDLANKIMKILEGLN